MSNQDGTKTGDRVTVPQILAHLIVLGQTLGLPDPDSVHANASNGIAGIGFLSREQLDMWGAALGCNTGNVTTQPYRDGWLHCGYVRGVRGWTVNLSAETTGRGTTEPVKRETLRKLSELAAVAP